MSTVVRLTVRTSAPSSCKHIEHQRHVADLGNILDPAHSVHQQGGGNDADGGVLRAADIDLTVQRSPAVDDIFLQGRTSCYPPGPAGVLKRPKAA